VIDLVSVLPFWFAFVLPSELRIVLLFRIVRFLKLARYSPALRSLLEALYAERRALFGCAVIFAGATLVSATFIHLAERDAQPDKFGTIPDAWSCVQGHLTREVRPDAKQNQTLRRRQRQVGLGLQATPTRTALPGSPENRYDAPQIRCSSGESQMKLARWWLI
jgi:hypothetical protein